MVSGGDGPAASQKIVYSRSFLVHFSETEGGEKQAKNRPWTPTASSSEDLVNVDVEMNRAYARAI